MAQSYTFRLQAEGLEQFRAQMEAAAKGNEALAQAWQRLLASSPQLATALDRAHAAVDRMATQARRAQTEVARVAAANDNAARSTLNLGQVIGQAGFQVQDFAVQVASGQSALIAFAQQGSQLAGVFGPTGAIAGAALAIGAIVAQLVSGKNAAEQMKEAIERQSESFRRVTEAAERWRRGLEQERQIVADLRAHYQSLSSARQSFELRQAAEEQRRILDAQETLRRQIGGRLFGLSAGIRSQLFELQEGAAQQYGRGSAEYQTVISGPEVQRLREIVAVIEEFREATPLTEEALARLSERIRELATGTDPLSRRLRAAADEAARAAPDVRKLEEEARNVNLRLEAMGAVGPTAAAGLREVREAARPAADALGGLSTDLAQVQARLDALRTGGLEALQRERQQQEDIAEVERLRAEARQKAEREIREEVRARGGQESEVAERLRATEAERLAAALRVVAARREEREATKEAEEAQRRALERQREGQRLAEQRAREAAQAARQREQEEQRAQQEAKRLAEQADREAKRLVQEQRREVQRAEEARQRQAERVTDSIVEYTADRFADLFDRNQKGWEGMLETFERTFRSLIARLAAEAIIRPIVTPIVSGLFGDGGAVSLLGPLLGVGGGSGGTVSLGGAPKAGGGVGGLTSNTGLFTNFNQTLRTLGAVYDLFSGQGGYLLGSTGIPAVDALMNTTLWGGGTVTAAEAASMSMNAYNLATQGVTVGSALSGLAGIAGGAFTAYQGLQRGGIGGYTQAAGGALMGASAAASSGLLGAAAMSSSIPVYGWIAGAVLALASLFMPGQKAHPGGAIIIGSDPSGALSVLDSRSKHLEDWAQIDQQVRTQLNELSRLLSDRGIRVGGEPGPLGYLGFGPAAQGHQGQYADIPSMIMGNLHRLTSSNPYIEQMLRAGRIGSLEELIGGADWIVNIYEPLVKAEQATSQWEQRIKALHDTFAPAIESAERLGLETHRLVAAWNQAVADLTAQRDQVLATTDAQLRARYLTATGQAEEAALITFDLQAAEERRAYEALLRDWGLAAEEVAARMAEMERVHGAERLAIQEQYAQQAKAAQEQYAQQAKAADAQLRARYLTATGQAGEAALITFDLQAAEERRAYEALLRDWGLAAEEVAARMAEMERVHGAERLAIQEQYAQQYAQQANAAFEAARQAYVSALDQEMSAVAAVAREHEAAARALRNAADAVQAFSQSLLLAAQSPLTPEQRLAEARSQFAGAQQRAMRGSPEERAAAAAEMQRLAQQRLDVAAQYYGTATAAYQAEFEATRSALSLVGAGLDKAARTEERALAAAERQLAELQALREEALSIGEQHIALLAEGLALGQVQVGSLAELRALGQQQVQSLDALGQAVLAAAQAAAQAAASAGAAARAAASAAGASVPGLAEGGWVGNGVWGRDSVLARYAGGGAIALAGGEFVVNAVQAARYSDVLPRINAGTFSPANDNGFAAIVAELRALRADNQALRAEVAELRRAAAAGAMETVAAVKEGTAIARQAATAERLRVARRA